MLRFKLTVFFLLSLAPNILFSGVLGDIVNGAIDKATSSIDLDSFLQMKCKDFNFSPSDLSFSIFDCEINLSSQKCYSQTTNSFQDILNFKNKHFDRDEVCKNYLSRIDENISSYKPFTYLPYIQIKHLPSSNLEVEQRVSEKTKNIVSPIYLFPNNAIAIQHKLKERAVLECSLSTDKEQCIASKSLAYSKAEKQDYDKNQDKAYSTFLKTEYMAVNRQGDLYEGTERILKKLPIEKRKLFIEDSLFKQRREILSKTYLMAAVKAQNSVMEQYLNVIAKSVHLSNKDVFKEISTKSIKKWSMP